MKTTLLLFAVTLFSSVSHAQLGSGITEKPPATLEQLDTMKTCTTPAQIYAAKSAIAFLNDFRWWHINNMVSAVSDDFNVWHSSWAHTFNSDILKPEMKAQYPMQKGQTFGKPGKNGMIMALAYIAYTNDIGSYEILPSRIDCVISQPNSTSQDVIVTTMFYGTSVVRDAEGYVRYVEKIVEPTKVFATVKDRLISKMYFDLRDETGNDTMKKLFAKMQAGIPDVTGKDPNRRGTLTEILDCFKYELNLSTTCTLNR